jgi:Na+/H+ antiporter NhaD/arsenite permease-like protein
MPILHATNTTLGFLALGLFIVAYLIVILEEFLKLRKCKSVLLASGLIWVLVALLAKQQGMPHIAEQAIKHNILEYGELLLFLLSAMTYVNVMIERKIFDALRNWLTIHNFSLRTLFWITGTLSFFISPFVDNLTAALIMCAVVMAIGKGHHKFITLSCINIVVGANAGGAFSPFGDITTLMVWQKEVLKFHEFFYLFIPATISYIVPAFIMALAIPKATPKPTTDNVNMAFGAKRVILLFILTIATAVNFHYYLNLPPAIGMITGLSYLALFDYYLSQKQRINKAKNKKALNKDINSFDILKKIAEIEWDTLLFFYGVMLCVGGLATIGYLEKISTTIYLDWGNTLYFIHKQTPANIIVGLLSSIIDNIPIMFAILTMAPTMSTGQWLLVTLTTGIGGSLLSIGSAAGVALMGQARGTYTFFSHLKWSWIILLGYFAGIGTHILINKELFYKMVDLH